MKLNIMKEKMLCRSSLKTYAMVFIVSIYDLFPNDQHNTNII